MKGFSLFCLLFFGLLALVNSEKLRTLSLKKGTAQIPRNLEVQTTTTIPKNISAYGSGLFGVVTDFSSEWMTQQGYTTIQQMAIMISSNETVFADGCPYFSSYDCKDPLCTEVQNSSISIQLPIIGINATRISYNFTDSATKAATIVNGSWQLTATPLLMKNCHESSGLPYIPSYPYSSANKGWIGLGTEGDATGNFQTATPIFSTHLNASKETGDLIFGFDETRISNYTPIITLNSDAQWRLNVTSIKYGNDISYTPTTSMTLVFDLLFEGLGVPKSIFDQLKPAWGAIDDMSFCSDDSDYEENHCKIASYNLSMISELTFTLADGTILNIDPYHYWSGEKSNYVPDNETQTNDWTETLYQLNSDNSGSEFIVLGYRPMSQFYSLFQKTTTGNTITLYHPVSQYEGANYTAPEKPADNGNEGNTTNPDDSGNGNGDGTGDGSSNTSGGDEAWIYYLIYAAISALVILIIIVFCCCCKNEPELTVKKELNIELKGKDTRSTETSSARI